MPIEIEMKAWVIDRDALRSRLARIGSFVRTYDKTDVYFHAPGVSDSGLPLEFRIRRESGRAVCTRKDKRVENGLEVNHEFEFDVGDAALFEDLMIRIGCTVATRKHKAGELFRIGSLSAELSEVEGLGTFVELEQLCDDEASRAEVEADIRGVMRELDIPGRLIESRRYTEMLAERTLGVFRSPTA